MKSPRVERPKNNSYQRIVDIYKYMKNNNILIKEMKVSENIYSDINPTDRRIKKITKITIDEKIVKIIGSKELREGTILIHKKRKNKKCKKGNVESVETIEQEAKQNVQDACSDGQPDSHPIK